MSLTCRQLSSSNNMVHAQQYTERPNANDMRSTNPHRRKLPRLNRRFWCTATEVETQQQHCAPHAEPLVKVGANPYKPRKSKRWKRNCALATAAVRDINAPHINGQTDFR
ncbi:unnamed protein product [Ceratitis capitata]|uniref:(Mediterranean fruit fly) hypothetical protein n=1 Tax=Ceratitis capitata TaxID=7213 RepID=A0A811UF04_CERCA|nr:unnamed protein product [Ceratitis capitata]